MRAEEVMNKSNLILKYFQKANRLTEKDKDYAQSLTQLFKWLTSNDKIHNDRSSKYLPNIPCTATIISKDNGIIAGLQDLEYLLKTFTTLTFTSQLTDGKKIIKGDIIARISGKSHEILSYERTILNILQRMSGIATETSRLVKSINRQQTTDNKKIYITATRKTPWMTLDKKAVTVGGGLTHRLSLSDGILIKDNHLVNNSIEMTLMTILKNYRKELIEIEVINPQQAHKVITTFQKHNNDNYLAILLDNFSPVQAKLLLNNLNRKYNLSQIIFEASGGITEKNIREWIQTGVDIISLGSLTHSAHAANLSLEIIPKRKF